jgi:TctA family transporter
MVLIVAAPMLAELAINFSTFEYFWLACLGLTCAIFISSADPVKGFLSLFLGLAIGCIGIDPAAGYPRFTFGNIDLMSGINFVPTMIGIFAVSELMRGVMSIEKVGEFAQDKVGALFRGLGAVARKYWKNCLRGSALGTLIGALPGAGADIAAWVSYAMAKRFSKESEKFGTGHIEGVVESTSSNNSAVAGAWIPALVFGIPGDSITAIVIGVLYMKGMNPGPAVFLENPQFIYAVFIIFILANLLMLPLGYAAIRGARHLLAVPKNILLPTILLFCIVGSFAMTNSPYGILLMLIFGVVGWLMEENGIPVAPLILGLVLGELLEQSFMTSMIKSDGSFLVFFQRPIAGILGAATLAIWVIMVWRALQRRQHAHG